MFITTQASYMQVSKLRPKSGKLETGREIEQNVHRKSDASTHSDMAGSNRKLEDPKCVLPTVTHV